MSGLFSSKPTPAPPIPAPTVMPLADSATMRKVKKKSVAEQQRRGGRQATILTAQNEQTDKLGG